MPVGFFHFVSTYKMRFAFRETFDELIQFEDILYSISEYSDTYLDSVNVIQRDGDGYLFKFSDICKQNEF